MRKAKRGLIVNISSQLGRVIVPNGGHYSATKFALEALSEQMAYELVPHGIDVTIIEPGGYPTDVWRNRNRYTGALKARLDAERAAAYPAVVARMGTEDGSGRSADPMDVPRTIAGIIALPPASGRCAVPSIPDPSRKRRSTRFLPGCRCRCSATRLTVLGSRRCTISVERRHWNCPGNGARAQPGSAQAPAITFRLG